MNYLMRVVLLAAFAMLAALPLRAASLIRDPNIENALSELAQPVLLAAGMPSSGTRILVVNDPALNAFVIDTQHIFLHSGLILRLKSAAELQAVIAHEVAHIQNGHIARRMQNMQRASTVAGFGVALAAATAATTGETAAAGALARGIMGAATQNFMSHTRTEESAADASGLRYLIRAGIDPSAYLRVFDLFRGQELLTPTQQDTYARSHPLSRDRFRAMEALIKAAPNAAPANPQAEYWMARAQAKLGAFLRAPTWAQTEARKQEHADLAQMMQAIAWHRLPDSAQAIAAIDRLALAHPEDPFVHELRGQILLESRRVDQAVAAYRRATELAPRNALILAGYGRAMLAAGQPREARDILERARARDFRNVSVLRDLAMAYAKNNEHGMASVVTAERYALLGQFADARLHANRALGQVTPGSRAGIRAQDVLSGAEAALAK